VGLEKKIYRLATDDAGDLDGELGLEFMERGL
jgi:hypothetical protein